MKRIFIGVSAFFFILVACRVFTPDIAMPDRVTPSQLPSNPTATTTQPTATNTFTPTTQPTLTPTPTPAIPTASPTITQPEPVFDVRTHPDGGLFVGDQVSFEVIAPPDFDLNDAVMRISDISENEAMLETQFAPFGIGGRQQATFYWGWDTSDLEAGLHPLSMSIQPLGITWTHTVTLGTPAQVPPPEPQANWVSDESDCCVFYYISDTAAAREITSTLTTADQLADQTASKLEIDFDEPLVVTLMPRVLGQGGFASSEIYISFLDRNYAGNQLETVLNHEMVHILDYRLGGEMRPTILIEGLAVYLTGGHYKPEALIPRAAALLPPEDRQDGLGLGWYLPLRSLSDDFYNAQHEIGYIQAGALVEYMIDIWGWEAYSAFYRDIHSIENGTQSDALDAALQAHFDLSLDELEVSFLGMLGDQEITQETIDDVRLTVDLLDTMRRYQQILDPSAYFLTAWLPNGPLMREKGIVADLVRRPTEIENIVIETLMVAAHEAINTGDYAFLEDALNTVNAVIDAIETGQPDPFGVNTLAKAHYEITSFLHETGYQVELITIIDNTAQVKASQGWPELTQFEFAATNSGWSLVSQ
jgi:hypothetical protein